MKTGILVGVPFTARQACAPHFWATIDSIDSAPAGRSVGFLFVADAPVEDAFAAELEHRSARLHAKADVLRNRQSLGYLGCANRILECAGEQRKHAVLLSPKLALAPGTIDELAEVGDSDPLIGFAAPRCNASALAPFPVSIAAETPAPEAFAAFAALRGRLPRVAYVPTASALCLLVKLNVLREFGGFAVMAGPYLEESDLIARANRCGYRTAIANHAFAYHADAPYAGAPEEAPAAASLRRHHPGYRAAAARYAASPAAKALRLVSCLAEEPPLPIAFDVSNYGRRRDGTSEYGTRLIASFAAAYGRKYRIHVICAPPVWKWHGFAAMPGVRREPVEGSSCFAAVIRPSQPFDLRSTALGPRRGAVSIVSMLDCIAYDCLNIRPPELESLWDFVLRYSDLVVFPSAFSRAQFARRFPAEAHGRHLVSLPSTDLRDYAPPQPAPPGDYLLIVGNAFAHKAVPEAVEALRAAVPQMRLTILGAKFPDIAGVTCYESGRLHPSAVQALFAGAKAVIYPSHYEGFGFPVLHALGHGRPVFVRDLPVYAEIRARVAAPRNIHAFGTMDELRTALTPENLAWQDDAVAVDDVGWDRAARELEAGLAQALTLVTADRIERRLEQLALLETAIAGSHEHVRRLKAKIEGFETSSSWRLTAPLRKLKRLFSSDSAGGSDRPSQTERSSTRPEADSSATRSDR
jgi:glycosyltransferase involved in cell wall biosynthesis/GT2 family glycosyltransferase